MTEERDNSAGSNPEHTPPASAPGGEASDSSLINPYQTPANHPDKPGAQAESGQSARPGPMFWIIAAVLIVLALLMTPLTGGMALPMLLGLVGGTIRASVIFARQRQSTSTPIRAELLLITSTVVTLLLLFSVAIAFVIVCAGTVMAVNQPPYDSSFASIWSVICGAVALSVFTFMFLRSMKWRA